LYSDIASKILKYQTEELKQENRRKGDRNTSLITSQAQDDQYNELLSEERDVSDQAFIYKKTACTKINYLFLARRTIQQKTKD
jgi:hypothetical protein